MTDQNTTHGSLNSPVPFVLLAFVLLAAAACGGNDGAAEKDADKPMFASGVDGERARYDNLTREGYEVQAFDLNKDESDDQWVIKSNAKTERIERDMNFDGRVDLWQYPDASGAIVEEEMDLDLDGVIDVVVFYENGVVTRKEMSTDFAGRFSIVKFYDQKGELLRVERDDDNDGDPDVWEYFEEGRRVRVGWDENADGQPDRFDDLN